MKKIEFFKVESDRINRIRKHCPKCGETTEIWTRVMGYHRPVSAFNQGKKAEHAERVCFTEAC